MFFVFLVILLAVLGICTIVGIVLFIISLVMKSRYKKKQQNISGESNESGKGHKKYYLIPGITGGVFLLPIILFAGFIAWAFLAAIAEQYTSLGYCVTRGNYERAEVLLKLGVDPDCTVESNSPAKDGEQTLLSVLCENGGFIDTLEDPADDVVTEEEKAMIRLLIEYGADIEARSYCHEKDAGRHLLLEDDDYYNKSDGCGYTPFLYAVENSESEIMEMLIEYGADVQAKDYCGYNAVHIVAENGWDFDGVPVLEILIENNVSFKELTNFGQDAWFLANRRNTANYAWDNDEIMQIIDENN